MDRWSDRHKLCCVYGSALNEEVIQYLVIFDEDTKVYNSLSHRNGDVPSVWTEVLDGRVGTLRDLNRSPSEVYTSTWTLCGFSFIITMLQINNGVKTICVQRITCSNVGIHSLFSSL